MKHPATWIGLSVPLALTLTILPATPALAQDATSALAAVEVQAQGAGIGSTGTATSASGQASPAANGAASTSTKKADAASPAAAGATTEAAESQEPATPAPQPETISSLASQNKDGAVLKSGTYVLDYAGKALDVSGGSGNDCANVQIYQKNGTAAQSWVVRSDSNGYVTLQNIKSGKYLNVSDGKAANGKNVWQYSNDSTAAMRWVVKKVGSRFTLLSALTSGSTNNAFALDVNGASTRNGANVQIYRNNGTAAQRWAFIEQRTGIEAAKNKGGSVLKSGDYVVSGIGSQALDVAGGDYTNGTNVDTWSKNSTGAQSWHVSVDDQGYVTLRNLQSGKVLDVSGASTNAGTNVAQYSSNGTGAQKWVAVTTSKGIELHSALSFWLSLDVSGASTRNGANVQIWASNGTDAQQWRFTAAPAARTGQGWKTLRFMSNFNRAIDVPSASAANNVSVQGYNANGTQGQSWWIRDLGNGTYTLQASCSGLYLSDVSGAKQHTDAGTSSQWKLSYSPYGGYVLTNVATGRNLSIAGNNRWALYDAGSGVKAGFYELVSKLNGNMRLDVAGASKSNGGNVQLYTSNGSLAQRWWLRNAGNDTFTLTNCASVLCLDIKDGRFANGSNAQQYAYNGSAAQRWYFTMGRSGLELRSKGGNFVLDVAGGKAANGGNVEVYSPNGTTAQAWSLKAVATPNKIGWQNPSWMPQVSWRTVTLPGYARGHGQFSYVSPSMITVDATRAQVVNAFVKRAYQYLGHPYVEPYSTANAVDCSGLVLQCLYATGMDMEHARGSEKVGGYNPWNHLRVPAQTYNSMRWWENSTFPRISRSQLDRGDLVFYRGHVAIYVGGGKIIHAANPHTGVLMSPINCFGMSPIGYERPFWK